MSIPTDFDTYCASVTRVVERGFHRRPYAWRSHRSTRFADLMVSGYQARLGIETTARLIAGSYTNQTA